MKSGTCPKCGSVHIYTSGQSGRAGYFIPIRKGIMKDKLLLTYYVCGQCAYFEIYVDDEDSLQDILKKWTPLNPRKSKRKNDE